MEDEFGQPTSRVEMPRMGGTVRCMKEWQLSISHLPSLEQLDIDGAIQETGASVDPGTRAAFCGRLALVLARLL